MEAELIRHLELLLSVYRAKLGYEETTVGKHCTSDGYFFKRLREGSTITARKYDAVVLWFSQNWPADVAWPEGVGRPASPEPTETVGDAA